MKKIIFLTFLFFFVVLSFAFANNNDFNVDDIIKREDFALAQRLQLDTLAAKYASNNKIYLKELYARDLIPTTSNATRDYYAQLNTRISGLEKINTQRERLEYLLNERNKSSIFSAIPNPLSIATMAFSSGSPLKAIIAIAGTALNATASYLDSKNQANLEHMQAQWNLDDQQKDELNSLITELYKYKCDIVKELEIPQDLYRKLTLSNDDMEVFIKAKEEADPSVKYAKLRDLNSDGRMDYLAEFWAELAKAAYEMENYENALKCISEYEYLYVNVFYHDKEYANMLKIKTFCLDNTLLNEHKYKFVKIADEIEKIWSNVDSDDWVSKYYCSCMCGQLYAESGNKKFQEQSYKYLSSVIGYLISDYGIKVDDYISGSYVENSKEQIRQDIEDTKYQYKTKQKEINTYLKDGKKKDSTCKMLEAELNELKKKQEKSEDSLKKFEEECRGLLPPSSEELCNIFKTYMALTDTYGMNEDALFNANKKQFVDVVGKRDKRAVGQIFNDVIPEKRIVKVKYKKEDFNLEIDIPLVDVSVDCEYSCSFIAKHDIGVQLIKGTQVLNLPNCECEIQMVKNRMDASFLVIKCSGKVKNWNSKEENSKQSIRVQPYISSNENKISVDYIDIPYGTSEDYPYYRLNCIINNIEK